MEGFVSDYHLAQFNRVQLLFTAFSLLLAFTSLWMFGILWTVLLCTVWILSLSAVSFLCYHPEPQSWRAALNSLHGKLFQYFYKFEINSSPSQRQTFGTKSKKPQVTKLCHKEVQKFIQLIMRDFVVGWYDEITNDSEFPEDVQRILEHVALEANLRLQKVDLDETICELLAIVLRYLEVLQKTGLLDYNGVKIFDVNHKSCLRAFENHPLVSHRALRNPAAEARYYRQGIDALIQCAVPLEYAKCDVACLFVREVLVKNIVEPLIDLLCDPDFLNEAIPIVLEKASLEKVDRELAEIQRENEELERQISRGRLIFIHRANQRRRFSTLSCKYGLTPSPRSPRQFAHFHEFNTDSSVPDTSPTDSKVASESEADAVDSPLLQPVTLLPLQPVHSPPLHPPPLQPVDLPPLQPVDSPPLHPPPLQPVNSPPLQPVDSPPLHPPPLQPVDSPPLQPVDSPPVNSPLLQPLDSLPLQPAFASTPELKDHSFAKHRRHTVHGSLPVLPGPCLPKYDSLTNFYDGDNDVVYVQLPPIFVTRHVRVDKGGNTHIGYILKFPKRMLSASDLRDLNIEESDTHVEAMRRYSDFVKFHSNLLRSPLAIYVRGLELPDKRGVATFMSKLPFTAKDLDPTMLLERKQGLESYIQSISGVEEVLSSELFRKFLKEGVRVLKEAHIVNPNRSAGRRKTILGIVKGHSEDEEDTREPGLPIEAVLSAYLNTHLPLPCRTLHTLPKLHTKARGRSRSGASVNTGSDKISAQHTLVTHNPLDCAKPSQESTSSVANVNAFSPEGSAVGATVVSPSSETTVEGRVATVHCHTTQVHSPPVVQCSTDGGETDTYSCSTSEPVTEKHECLHAAVSHTETAELLKPLASNQRHESREHQTFYSQFRSLVHTVFSTTVLFLSQLLYVVKKGFYPITRQNTLKLTRIQEKSTPLTNTLLSLAAEASKRHCPRLWATNENTQLAVTTLLGGAIDIFLWKELHILVYSEENWSRALYHLRHTLWPEGKLDTSLRRPKTDKERTELKGKAAEAFKQFLPDFFPYLVGTSEYDRAVRHCVECLQNPRISRHFLLAMVDLLLVKVIPEIQNPEFQKQLVTLRVTNPISSRKSQRVLM